MDRLSDQYVDGIIDLIEMYGSQDSIPQVEMDKNEAKMCKDSERYDFKGCMRKIKDELIDIERLIGLSKT